MVEGARLESVYTGNCIKGSNPLVSAGIIHLQLSEFKKSGKIKGFKILHFLTLFLTGCILFYAPLHLTFT